MMSTTPLASIIRQPHGPSSGGFGGPVPTTSSGPPPADADSTLRRANTVSSTPRHQVSASISSTPAASSAFHGNKGGNGPSRFRSGSLSSSNPDPGLVRKGSGRAVRKEVPVMEVTEEGSSETGYWGKGLSRQSSLPSRRGYNPAMPPPSEPVPQRSSANPPPRPPRRLAIDPNQQISTPPAPPSAHAPSHSLSSLAMFSSPAPSQTTENMSLAPTLGGAGVSRTQSLRAQAKHHGDSTGLGRSASMKAAGEHHRSLQTIAGAASPPSQPNTPHQPFTPPSPPPVSSTAAFPPFGLPQTGISADTTINSEGADIKRHQSLTQGYGSSNRVRERLERSPAVLNLQKGHSRGPSTSQDAPPTSPIGHSVWSPAHGGDDGWSRPSTQHIQDAFQAMNLGVNPEETRRGAGQNGSLRQPQAQAPPNNTNGHPAQTHHIGDEPSWVANLVGHANGISPQPVRTASAPQWPDRDAYMRGAAGQAWPIQPPFLAQPFGYLPIQQQPYLGQGYEPRDLAAKLAGQPGGNQYPQYPGYPPQPHHFNPVYPSPPVSAPLPSEDPDVLELAKSKGWNPATFDCRPSPARFFVIKSYTEEDVQKSLKHEIWSSTVLGNKRLDTAFRESADQMPIYLFFSVNGSRHFCGVAQMLTPVDETQSANVWAENNKWKGIFKVKWIFVRDVPSAALRHIRLINTPEQKPITNSRDTQELHHEAGCEVLKIFLDHQNKSKTSLLQDFAYYERLSANRPQSAAGQRGPTSAPPAQVDFSMPQSAQPAYPMSVGNPQFGMQGQQVVPPVPQIPARFR